MVCGVVAGIESALQADGLLQQFDVAILHVYGKHLIFACRHGNARRAALWADEIAFAFVANGNAVLSTDGCHQADVFQQRSLQLAFGADGDVGQ